MASIYNHKKLKYKDKNILLSNKMEKEQILPTDICGHLDGDAIVDPWNVKGKLTSETYVKLIDKFGVSPITPELLKRFEKVTGHEPHKWMKRGFFFAHRELDKVLDQYEAKKPIFLYTGRGPT